MSSLTSKTGQKTFQINIPSQLHYEKIPRATVAIVAQKMGFAPEKIENLKTAMSEAVTNAIEHGNKLDSEARVYIELTALPTMLIMRVMDEGIQPIPDIPAKREVPPDHNRGWGLQWIKQFTDEVTVSASPGCNEIKMVAYLSKGT